MMERHDATHIDELLHCSLSLAVGRYSVERRAHERPSLNPLHPPGVVGRRGVVLDEFAREEQAVTDGHLQMADGTWHSRSCGRIFAFIISI